VRGQAAFRANHALPELLLHGAAAMRQALDSAGMPSFAVRTVVIYDRARIEARYGAPTTVASPRPYGVDVRTGGRMNEASR
jgi:hypothetical protein